MCERWLSPIANRVDVKRAGNALELERGSKTLGCPCQFFVFWLFGANKPDERIAEEKIVLPTVDAPPHFIDADLEMLSRGSMPGLCIPGARGGGMHRSFVGSPWRCQGLRCL